MKNLLIVSALICATAVPAAAQTQNGLVNVNVGGDILSNILSSNNINTTVQNVTVQVPISVAANVCGLTVLALSVLRRQGKATCTAQSGSDALSRSVARSLTRQKQ
jgi:hypothetical protein